jgi:hypothetical protein
MSRRKRTSAILQKAELRASSMVSIEPELDLGNDLTLKTYREAINELREKQKQYNALLADERSLGEMSEHMLSGVKVKFGRDSNEYEMAGGVKQSERKRPQRKVPVVTTT